MMPIQSATPLTRRWPRCYADRSNHTPHVAHLQGLCVGVLAYTQMRRFDKEARHASAALSDAQKVRAQAPCSSSCLLGLTLSRLLARLADSVGCSNTNKGRPQRIQKAALLALTCLQPRRIRASVLTAQAPLQLWSSLLPVRRTMLQLVSLTIVRPKKRRSITSACTHFTLFQQLIFYLESRAAASYLKFSRISAACIHPKTASATHRTQLLRPLLPSNRRAQ
jgi:hypothetical protein